MYSVELAFPRSPSVHPRSPPRNEKSFYEIAVKSHHSVTPFPSPETKQCFHHQHDEAHQSVEGVRDVSREKSCRPS